MSALAPKICPQCEAQDTFAIYQDKMSCRRCGYVIKRDEGGRQPSSPVTDKPSLKHALSAMFGDKMLSGDDVESTSEIFPTETLPPLKIQARYGISYAGQLPPYARAAFNSGQSFIERNLYPEAKDAFLRAVNIQPDFFECYYWLALLSNNPTEKRDYLTKVIAYMPNHGEARRELMLLDGTLTQAQADALVNPYLEPEKRHAGGAVNVTTKNIRCPNCGSERMTVDDVTGLPYCDSCGYIEDKPRPATGGAGGGSLFAALLHRRVQSAVWQVGERLLLCNSCGADRTIPSEKLSDYCPYCGSKHVVIHDALGSFSQPDRLIPFTVTRAQAGERIKSQLNSRLAKMRRWVDNNTVERATLEGHFLPYWVFDTTIQVRRSVIYTEVEQDDRGHYSSRRSQRYETEEFTELMDGVLVCAVKSPTKSLTDRLGHYIVNKAVDYTPDLITKTPTQIYSIDFDHASLDARAIVSRTMREKYDVLLSGNGRVQSVSASATDMSFQLVLMPVWIATLYEEDGDVRSALVNGQTGVVIFGKSQKPPR